jgi:hypothetical protein
MHIVWELGYKANGYLNMCGCNINLFGNMSLIIW